jgi:hypothetical protein
MPRWAIWLLNFLVVASLTGLAYLFKWLGPEFCFGLLVGFWFCYINYKCWRQDYADEARAHFTDPEPLLHPPSRQHLYDR